MFPLLFKQLILLLQNCKSSCLSVSKSDLTLGGGVLLHLSKSDLRWGVLLHLSKSDLRWGVPHTNTNRCYLSELWTATDALTENPGLLYLQWGGTSMSVQIWPQVGGYHAPTQIDVTTLNSEQQLMLLLKIQGFYTFSGGSTFTFLQKWPWNFFPVWIYIRINILI